MHRSKRGSVTHVGGPGRGVGLAVGLGEGLCEGTGRGLTDVARDLGVRVATGAGCSTTRPPGSTVTRGTGVPVGLTTITVGFGAGIRLGGLSALVPKKSRISKAATISNTAAASRRIRVVLLIGLDTGHTLVKGVDPFFLLVDAFLGAADTPVQRRRVIREFPQQRHSDRTVARVVTAPVPVAFLPAADDSDSDQRGATDRGDEDRRPPGGVARWHIRRL